MPISVTYNPISAAMNLAKKGGEGESQMRRHAMGQDALNRLDKQTAMAMQSRAQQVQEGMALREIQNKERLYEEQAARQRAMDSARVQQEQQALATDEMYKASLIRQRENENRLAAEKAQRDEEWKKKGFGLSERRVGVAEAGEKRLKKAADEPKKVDADKKFEQDKDDIRDKEAALGRWLKDNSDKRHHDRYGEYKPRTGVEPLEHKRILDAKNAAQASLMTMERTRVQQNHEKVAAAGPNSTTIMPTAIVASIAGKDIKIPEPPSSTVAPEKDEPITEYPNVQKELTAHFMRYVLPQFPSQEEWDANLPETSQQFDVLVEAQGWRAE